MNTHTHTHRHTHTCREQGARASILWPLEVIHPWRWHYGLFHLQYESLSVVLCTAVIGLRRFRRLAVLPSDPLAAQRDLLSWFYGTELQERPINPLAEQPVISYYPDHLFGFTLGT